MPLNTTPIEGQGWHYRWLRLQAIAWFVLGRQRAAGALLDQMLQRWPQDTYALASRTHLNGQAGRRAEAIADARALVEAHPRRSAAHWFNLGYLLEADQQHEAAEQAFRQAVALDEKLDRAWYGLGMVLKQQGRYVEAVQALTRNTELQPMSPYGWVQLARVQVEREQPDEARRIIRHLRGFEPRVAAQLERETGLAQ